ncbi:BFD-like [2Fe-2S] binding protein [Breznakibacter xylanolyticus]|uniref:Bacterioferritin-associated ferredoxin n=1 Tax=Breznakibacter xylanolyticus TaxID=990 RepID=A0A2W7N1A1_9BACT|nr:(2Fe-2S)-binding protein [Breznakibacter xylanolyticus]MBN2743867.1 (2Fe-2S)-binding protein [Marinilabiliaceae bacterium]PZX13850.1 BFD-like [2Fe-2S] binding protein [Breznakibacter xylanolyticus]
MPSHYICQCNQVTELEIRTIINKKIDSNIEDVQLITGAGTRCGRCRTIVNEIVTSQIKQRPITQLKLF